MFAITKTYRFEAAHRLIGHDGKCARLHGHSYRVDVGLKSGLLDWPNHSADRMVVDFAELDNVMKPLIDSWDHHFLVPEEDYNMYYAGGWAATIKDEYVILPITRTTAEELAGCIAIRVAEAFKALRQTSPDGPWESIFLDEVTVWETETSRATWRG